jgi:hypothetical protein
MTTARWHRNAAARMDPFATEWAMGGGVDQLTGAGSAIADYREPVNRAPAPGKQAAPATVETAMSAVHGRRLRDAV